ncbi:Agrin [Papilio xuthus]|uniref:Agrin n=1 Tax=Papilio xuthus TaxID=66420 RepID=A0A194PUU8_PAPXU|nr:Agrin [Papilio xuthus]
MLITRVSLFHVLLATAFGCYLFPSAALVLDNDLKDVICTASDVPDPCRGVSCGPGETCRPSSDGRSYHCECPASCPSYGDHEGARPLCASDARDYPGDCEMRRAACQTNSNITFMYYGKCDPCAGVTCPEPEVCQLDERRQPVCRCAEPCPLEFSPVCASDGKTYSNECQMHRESCRARKQLRVIFKGQCSSGVNPCSAVECRHGAECRVEEGGAVCACAACEPVLRPVCGSDGRTHNSDCELRRAACQLGRDIKLLHAGACDGCENKKCEHYAVCESDGVSEASCVCPKHCEEGTETEEACGSDNQTYSSVCALRDVACREKRHLHVKHMGSCESCAEVKCPSGTFCARGTCACSRSCAGAPHAPVCADNLHTYAHECALHNAACEARARGEAPPRLVHHGDCVEKDNGEGTNKTAKNESNDIRSVAEAESGDDSGGAVCARVRCAYEATCAVQAGQPRCACLFDCAAAAPAPVCASDLRLYPTLCHMKLEACRRQEDLRLRPLALCKGLEFRPCGDDEPLTDGEGRVLDCGGGPRRKDCPVGSYCHHTAKAATCCKKDKAVAEKECQESWHGCCADGVTAARGPGGAGCPAQCGCHRLGAVAERCDETGQCICRPGVGGHKCDRCEPGYWGLPRIGTLHAGCIPCGCSAFGSVREDCEQMTGRCVCKPGIQGQKCTVCSNHEHTLGPNGCFDPESTQLPATNCELLTCYFGAYCVVRSGLVTCECAAPECPAGEGPAVCGSDGRSYVSACHLRAHACRTQADVVVQAFGACGEGTPHVRRGSRSAGSRSTPTHNITRTLSPNPDIRMDTKYPSSNSLQYTDASVDTSDSGKPDSPEPELSCVDVLPPAGYR